MSNITDSHFCAPSNKSKSLQRNKNHYWARIVIVSFNSGDDLQICIDHLKKQTLQDFEVVIVDNNETSKISASLSLPRDRYAVLEADSNLGFSGGSNYGAKGAMTEWIITLNPDSWVEPDWLENLFQASRSFPNYAMISSTIKQVKNPDLIDSFGDYFSIFGVARNSGAGLQVESHPTEPCEVFSPSGAAAAYRRKVFHQSGGFDESFFCYLEDVDLGFRLRLYGEKCLQCPNAYVRHIGSSSTGAHSDFKYFHSHRNNIVLIVKNTPATLLWLMIPAFVFSQLWWLFRNRKNTGMRARVDGVKAGLRLIPVAWRKRYEIKAKREVKSMKIAQRLSWTTKAVTSSQFVFWKIQP